MLGSANREKPGQVQPSRHSLSSAACSRRRSTTYIPVGVDSGLRRNDDEERTKVGRHPDSPLSFR